MKQNKFPPSWNEKRVKETLSHYESQIEEECAPACRGRIIAVPLN